MIVPRHGEVVGASALPIDEENRGNRMLQKMGWKVGDTLGALNQGLLNPLEAVIRAKRRGLGAA